MNMTDKYVGSSFPFRPRTSRLTSSSPQKRAQSGKSMALSNECVADDVKSGKVTSFPQAVQLEADEVVVSSWIVCQSREDRDRVNAAVMSDSRLRMDPQAMPFDGKQMFWGGFKVLLAM